MSERHEALLLVLSEPGPAVDLKEFNEWYDEEHVPLRMSSLPEFLTGARYEAIDGQQPSYAALYEVSRLGLFDEPKYQSLRTKRSAREAELFTRIGTIDRRTYRCIEVDQRSSSDQGTYPPFLITAELAKAPTELLTEIKALDGWQKTQVGKIVDSSIIGRLQPSSNDSSEFPPQSLLVFEFSNQDQLKQLCELLDYGQIVIRKWKLYRGWDNKSF